MKSADKILLTFASSEKPIKWLFYGDSITHGAAHTAGWRDYTEIFSERVRTELQRSEDVVIKTAYNGNTTRHLLDNFDWRVRQFQPHVVLIMIGMNDCCVENRQPRVPLEEFRHNLLSLVKQIRGLSSALPILQTTCPILNGMDPKREPYLGKYMAEVREVSKQTQSPLVDHYAYWKRQAGLIRHVPGAWMDDALHPNEKGHRVFAGFLFKKLGIFDVKSKTCKMADPKSPANAKQKRQQEGQTKADHHRNP